MKRVFNFKTGAIFVLLTCIVGYFTLLPFDYKITFKSTNAPWLFYHIIQLNQQEVTLIKQGENELAFESKPKEDSNYRLVWNMQSLENEETSVEVEVHFTQNRISEKMKILLGQSHAVNQTLDELKKLTDGLVTESSQYRWDTLQEDQIGSASCLCKSIESKISEKANQMNKNIDGIARYLPIGKKDPPRLYINDMDLEEQTIQFDFCFPLPKKYELPELKDETLFVTEQPAIKGYAQAFFGNFSQSHRGWFKAIQKLEIVEKQIQFPAVEVFYDSPFSFSPENKWKSILYLSTSQRN